MQEINASSSEQAEGIEQVTMAVTQLDQVILQNAAGTEEMACTSEELASQAQHLRQVAAFFKTHRHTGEQTMEAAPEVPVQVAAPSVEKADEGIQQF